MELRNKVALVIGGSSGIGEAIVGKFASEGARCAVVASSSLYKARKVAKSAGRGARPYACDITKPAEVNKLVAKVLKDFKRIDILVNSAGVFYPTPAGETKTSDMNRMVDINLKGTWNIINAVTPHMRERKRGNIINISSVAGVVALPAYALYCGTKAAVVAMTKAMALELSRDGIHVNTIAPGNTASPMNVDIRNDPELAPVLEFMQSRTPSGKTYSEPEDMANVALFLASPRTGASIYGSVIVADEGFAAGVYY
jgi:NAD(P)-dependent dehydrogenase (short-subunit alcohol dehydrogenase family)